MDEIAAAVSTAGASNVTEATTAQFLRAFRAVLMRVKEPKFPEYVTSAIKLRPDLAPQITAAAIRARRGARRVRTESCRWVDPIIRAAVAAAPDARRAIVRAALEAEPDARECIFAAAGVESMAFAFEMDAGNMGSAALGTINPANLSENGNMVSPNQMSVAISFKGETLVLPRDAAEQFLRDHPAAARASAP